MTGRTLRPRTTIPTPDHVGNGGFVVHSTDDGATVSLTSNTSGDRIEFDIDADRALDLAATLLLSGLWSKAARGADPEAVLMGFMLKVDAQVDAAGKRGQG